MTKRNKQSIKSGKNSINNQKIVNNNSNTFNEVHFHQNNEGNLMINSLGERIIFEEKIRTIKTDLIIVRAQDPMAAVFAEHEWLDIRYPGRIDESKELTSIKFKEEEIIFDVFHFKLGEKGKEVFFDITEYFENYDQEIAKRNTENMFEKIYSQ